MKWIKRFLIFTFFLIILIWVYTNSLVGVKEQVKSYLAKLESELVKEGHNPDYFVISGRRWKLDNYLLTKFGGASKNSKHKSGEAIDIIVLDINDDNEINSKDVDIVYEILDKRIVKNKGGIGSYKNESGFFNKQMIHFDCRGNKSRWNR